VRGFASGRRVTFFFDNHVSPSLVAALHALGEDVAHIRDHFPDAKDVEWMPQVAQRGWIVVTADFAIWKQPVERAVFEREKLVGFFFHKGFVHSTVWEQALQVLKAWPRIKELAAKARGPKSYRVTPNG